MNWLYYLWIPAGYLIGCINTAAIIARCKGFDIRQKGSGNAGASNALVTMGKGAAVCSALVDILKALIPVLLLAHVLHLPAECAHLPVLTGAAVILGHMLPFWMQFRGGKGFASLLGLTLGLDWRLFLICIGILAVLLFTTKYIALATISCAVVLPLWVYFMGGRSVFELIVLCVISAIIISKHIQNIKRIANGTEIRLGEKAKDAPAEQKSES